MLEPIRETFAKLPPGTNVSTTLHSGRINVIGITPMKTHAPASTATGIKVETDSLGEDSISAFRGLPRNATPYTFTKQAAANAPVNASAPPARGSAT